MQVEISNIEIKPGVSIIMPAYNAQKYIDRAVTSILQQTYTDWEFLIVDDGSNDNTAKIIQTYANNDPRIKFIKNNANIGYLKSINKLLSLTKGELITFQDADDWSQLNRLEKQVEFLKTNIDIALVGTWFYTTNEAGEVISHNKRPSLHEDILDYYKTQNPVLGASAMIKREVYTKIGGFREFFNNLAYQDYDWISLIIEHFKTHNLEDFLYFYRQHPVSNSKIISPKRIISLDIVNYLIQQRAEGRKDDIESNNFEMLHLYIDKKLKPFDEDKSLVFRTYAQSFIYNRMYKEALKSSFKAFLTKPVKTINIKTLFFCLKQFLLKNRKE